MNIQAKSRLLRLGDARRLTRASGGGEYHELNPVRMWDMPPE